MSNAWARRSMLEAACIDGLDDWTYESWVTGIVQDAGAKGEALERAATIGLIAELIVRGLKTPGDVTDAGFVPWDCMPGEAIERITREWVERWTDEWPHFGALVWLANTPAGDELARAALVREGDS